MPFHRAWFNFFQPPYTQEGKNNVNVADLLTKGIEPGSPVQQATALFNTPLPLWIIAIIWSNIDYRKSTINLLKFYFQYFFPSNI